MLQSINSIIALAKEMKHEDLASFLEAVKPKLKTGAIEAVKVGVEETGDKKSLYFFAGERPEHATGNCLYFRDGARMYKMAYLLSQVLKEGERRWYDSVIEANLKFNDITLKQPNLMTMIKYFNKLIQNPVIIYDEFFNVIAATDETLCDYEESRQEPVRYEMRNLFYYKQKVYFNHGKASKSSCSRLLYPVLPAGGGVWKGYLAIFDLKTPYEEMDMMILEIFANSALTEMRRRLELQDVERKFISDFVYDLVYRKEEKAEELLRRAKGLNVAADGVYTMIVVQTPGTEGKTPRTGDKAAAARYEFMNDSILNHIDNLNQKYFEQDIVTKFDTDICILHKLYQHNEEETYEDVKAHCTKILNLLHEFFPETVIHIGIGNISLGILNVAAGFHQAMAALSYGEIIHETETSFIMAHGDNSLLKLFGRLKEIDCLDEMIPENLQEIWDYDLKYHTQFYDTLKMYLNCNCNAKKAAEKLYVHYKTMLYRIEKLKNNFHVDFEDAGSRLFLELGIHLLDMQKQ